MTDDDTYPLLPSGQNLRPIYAAAGWGVRAGTLIIVMGTRRIRLSLDIDMTTGCLQGI